MKRQGRHVGAEGYLGRGGVEKVSASLSRLLDDRISLSTRRVVPMRVRIVVVKIIGDRRTDLARHLRSPRSVEVCDWMLVVNSLQSRKVGTYLCGGRDASFRFSCGHFWDNNVTEVVPATMTMEDATVTSKRRATFNHKEPLNCRTARGSQRMLRSPPKEKQPYSITMNHSTAEPLAVASGCYGHLLFRQWLTLVVQDISNRSVQIFFGPETPFTSSSHPGT